MTQPTPEIIERIDRVFRAQWPDRKVQPNDYTMGILQEMVNRDFPGMQVTIGHIGQLTTIIDGNECILTWDGWASMPKPLVVGELNLDQ